MIRLDYQAFLYLIPAYLLVGLLHELGHVLVGWAVGYRNPSIWYGLELDRRMIVLRFLPVTIHVHLGLDAFFVPARYRFGTHLGPIRPYQRALVAAGGPLACLLLLMVPPVWSDLMAMLSGVMDGRFRIATFQRAITWMIFSLTWFPLIPMRYRSTNVDSDGAGIISALKQHFRSRSIS